MEENNEDIGMIWSDDPVNKYFHVRILAGSLYTGSEK